MQFVMMAGFIKKTGKNLFIMKKRNLPVKIS